MWGKIISICEKARTHIILYFGLTTIDDGKGEAGSSWSHLASFHKSPGPPGHRDWPSLVQRLWWLPMSSLLILPQRALGSKHALLRHSLQPDVCLRPDLLNFCANLGTRHANYPRSDFSIEEWDKYLYPIIQVDAFQKILSSHARCFKDRGMYGIGSLKITAANLYQFDINNEKAESNAWYINLYSSHVTTDLPSKTIL